jgi:uncharacterized protein
MGQEKPKPGKIVWQDLTVPDASTVRDFYKGVVGWDSSDHDMEEYVDYNVMPKGTDDVVAGICHARGTNANVPAQWLVYISVDDVDASAKRCVELGGKVIDGPRAMGSQQFCVIQDPAGAVAALIGG